jgi:hypothetical protein
LPGSRRRDGSPWPARLQSVRQPANEQTKAAIQLSNPSRAENLAQNAPSTMSVTLEIILHLASPETMNNINERPPTLSLPPKALVQQRYTRQLWPNRINCGNLRSLNYFHLF